VKGLTGKICKKTLIFSGEEPGFIFKRLMFDFQSEMENKVKKNS